VSGGRGGAGHVRFSCDLETQNARTADAEREIAKGAGSRGGKGLIYKGQTTKAGKAGKAWDDSQTPTYIKFGTHSSNVQFNKGQADVVVDTEVDLLEKEKDKDKPRFYSTFPSDQAVAPEPTDDGSDIRGKEHGARMRDRIASEAEKQRKKAQQHGAALRRMLVEQAASALEWENSGLDEANPHVLTQADPSSTNRNVLGVLGSRTKRHSQQHLKSIQRAARYAQLGLSQVRVLQQRSQRWLPPCPGGDPQKLAALRATPLRQVSARQMLSVREWLISLGLSVRDGEGGYFYWNAGKSMAVHSYPAPPLSLTDDRLRNGSMLCALLHVLEPDAARHAHLAPLLHAGKSKSKSKI